MAEVAYAVHTRSCSYLLDEGGVCRWIISPTGMVPVDVRRCVGAQFVACLEASHPGLLAGELLLGANALFVKRDEETGSMVLLRTGRIEHVEFHASQEGISSQKTEEIAATEGAPHRLPAAKTLQSAGGAAALGAPKSFGPEVEAMPSTQPLDPASRPKSTPPGTPDDRPGLAPPRRRAAAPRAPLPSDCEDSFLDPEDLVQYDQESTVTLTMPLFRPEVQARYLAGRRGQESEASRGEAPPAPASASDQDTLRAPRNRKPWPE